MATKVSLHFSATIGGRLTSGAGWSELYWRNTADSAASTLAFLLARAGGVSYIDRRLDLLTRGWRIDSIRVAESEHSRIVAEEAVNLPGAFTANDGAQDEQPYDRLLYKVVTNGIGRTAFLGGIPRAIVDAGGNYIGDVPAPTIAAAAWHLIFSGTFEASLVASTFAVRHLLAPAPYSIESILVADNVGISATPRKPVLVLTGDVTAFFPRDTVVSITECNTTTNINGQWTVENSRLVAGATYIRLYAKRGKTVAAEPLSPGYVTPLHYTYANLADISPKRGGSRKAGRFISSSRGRRSNRR